MAFSLNKITLIGNLGGDAETSFTTNDVSVTKFSIATTYSYKGKDGNWVDETTWHNVVAFRLSDFYQNALKKGKKFYVEGRLTKREYTDKDGNKRYFTEVISDRLIPLDSKGSKDDEMSSDVNYNDDSSSKDDLPF